MLLRASRRAAAATLACSRFSSACRTSMRSTTSSAPPAASSPAEPSVVATAVAATTAETTPWATTPPPHRFVRRWFLPGVDRPPEPSPSSAAASAARRGPVPPPGQEAAAAKDAAKSGTAATATAASSDAQGKAPVAGAPVAAAAASTGSPTPSVDPDEARAESKVLMEGLRSRNAHIKTLLVAGLGNSFARAGIHNDGIRTSFSAVNTQSIKQLTGLKRIPPKLMLSCMTNEDRSITWLDISAHPTATLTEYKESVQEILIGLGMHQSMINDSAEPVLLPQVTVSKDMRCLLMRYATEAPIDNTQDTFQDLTNRFTLFMTADSVVTVHRTQCTYVEELKMDWQRNIQGLDTPAAFMGYLLFYFVKETLGTFSTAISKCIVQFDRYESGLFVNNKNRSNLAREIYHIKRRASVYSRTLKLTQDAFSHMAAALHVDVTNVQYQEVQHSLSHVESIAEELNANADSVLQLLFQLSSYQVNELMRVLTLFSAFFIPLSFISSAYGMNFENLPFLHAAHGELFCGGLMVFVGTVIYFWFKSKHFI